MKPLILIPHPVLQPYIKHYVYCGMGTRSEWTSSNSAPSGCTALAITCSGKNVNMREAGKPAHKYESVAFSGQTTSYKKIFTYDRLLSFFVIFRPSGAYRVLGIHQGECRNTFINLTDLLGGSVRYFVEELANQTKSKDIKSVVERFLIKQMQKLKRQEESDHLAYVAKQIRQFCHQESLIRSISRQEGYSISRLERHMKKIVGITPKQYQRIMRFNATLQYIKQGPSLCTWAQVANRFGYFDQAHFIKEFKYFYGKTPARYAEEASFLSDIAFRKQGHVTK